MKDLIPNDEVGLIASDIEKAIAKDKNAKAIVNSTVASGKAKKSQRDKVRESLKKVSVDGKSYAGLHEVELAMNKLKLDCIKAQDDSLMKSLKSCIEKVFIELAKDDKYPFHTMENRKSMKNVTIKNANECRLSEVLQEKGGNKQDEKSNDAFIETDFIINLTADDKNEYYSKNKVLFDSHCEVHGGEFIIDDDTFNYSMSLFTNMQKELIKRRKDALAEWHKEVNDIVEKASSKN